MRRSVCDGLPMPDRRSSVDIRRNATINSLAKAFLSAHSMLPFHTITLEPFLQPEELSKCWIILQLTQLFRRALLLVQQR